jgi:hypothetical protein
MILVAIKDIPFQYKIDGSIKKYGLTRGKFYKLARPGQYPLVNNIEHFHPIFHFDGSVIPFLKENFVSLSEWREIKLNEIITNEKDTLR